MEDCRDQAGPHQVDLLDQAALLILLLSLLVALKQARALKPVI
jgi:hypothetical protein